MEQMQPVMEEESSNQTAGIKRQQDLLSSKTEKVEAARRQTDKTRDLLIMAEGKVAVLRNAAEETRSMLDQSIRLRRELENAETSSIKNGRWARARWTTRPGGRQRPSRT